MKDSVKQISWKLGTIFTKVCKGIQFLGKLDIAIVEPLPLTSLEVPLTKIVVSATAILWHTILMAALPILLFTYSDVII